MSRRFVLGETKKIHAPHIDPAGQVDRDPGSAPATATANLG